MLPRFFHVIILITTVPHESNRIELLADPIRFEEFSPSTSSIFGRVHKIAPSLGFYIVVHI